MVTMEPNEMIYLDHAAATPVDSRVLKAMMPYFQDEFFNPSSPYAPAVKVRRDYEEARRRLAICIGAKPAEIIFTAGATESINLAFANIKGHVAVAKIEHKAVLESAKAHEHSLILADSRGYVTVEAVERAMRENTELVSVALANNELGTVQPIRDIANLVRRVRKDRLSRGDRTPIYFHCDASQGVGQLEINVARLGVDMLTLNSGKMYGPKMTGLLWVASDVLITPIILGGGQEMGRRGGTENVTGVIGMARAMELANEGFRFESKRLMELRAVMKKNIEKAFAHAVFNGHPKNHLPSHLHVSFDRLDGERLVYLLENRGVMVATGSACSASSNTRSHVLEAIGLSASLADGSIRITMGHLSTPENVETASRIIIEELTREYERVRA
jgi:cysteine desulfurase